MKAATRKSLPKESRLFDKSGVADHDQFAEPKKPPVVEVLLTGVARFSRTEIDTVGIKEVVEKHLSPLDVRIRSLLQEAPTGMLDSEGTLRRHVVERMIFQNLIRADDRFAPFVDEMAEVAGLLKQMVLDGASATEVAEEVQSRIGAASRKRQAGAAHTTASSLQSTNTELRALKSLLDISSGQSQDEGMSNPRANLQDDVEQDSLPGKGPDSTNDVKTKH